MPSFTTYRTIKLAKFILSTGAAAARGGIQLRKEEKGRKKAQGGNQELMATKRRPTSWKLAGEGSRSREMKAKAELPCDGGRNAEVIPLKLRSTPVDPRLLVASRQKEKEKEKTAPVSGTSQS